MKHCIAVTEILTRTVIVDADSLEQAIECVKEAYAAQKIILDAGDLIPNPTTGESAAFTEADWIDSDEVQKKEADFTL